MIPDYCEALTAWRVWDTYHNGLLTGQAVHEAWPPYEALRATCASVDREGAKAHLRDGQYQSAPQRRCNCGIHAYKTEPQVMTRIREDNGSFVLYDRPPGRVWGTVKVWGRIIEHADGYRAEYAYPDALWCEDAKLAPRVAALYGVPCVVKALERPKRVDEDDLYGTITHYYHSYYGSMNGPVVLSGVGVPTAPPSGLASPGPSVIVQPPGKFMLPAKELTRWQRRLAQPTKTTAVDAQKLLRGMVYSK